jgi:hypothetical protein
MIQAQIERSSFMVLVDDAIWDSVTLAVILMAFFYAWRTFSIFRGGPLGRPYGYAVAGGGVILIAWILRLILDFEGINPVAVFGISVRDVAVMISAALFLVAGRGLVKFWTTPNLGRR